MKVHYTGYSSSYDEWKPKDEIVLITQEVERFVSVMSRAV